MVINIKVLQQLQCLYSDIKKTINKNPIYFLLRSESKLSTYLLRYEIKF